MLDGDTVSILANHELVPDDSNGGSFPLTGTRVSYFDIDKETREIVDAVIAINQIYNASDNLATEITME